MKFDKNMFKSNDDGVLDMSDAAQFNNKEYMDCKFLLDIRMIKKHQQKDEKMQHKV